MEKAGADKVLAEYPDLKVVRSVNGNWTANVTKTVVLQALATNPTPIDAVWTTGSESRVVAEAFAVVGDGDLDGFVAGRGGCRDRDVDRALG